MILANIAAVSAATLLAAESAATVLLVALAEGACLGLLQWKLLGGRRPDLARYWVYATLAGTVIARALQFVAETGPLLTLSYRWPVAAQFGMAVLAGTAVGTIMAVPQFWLLRPRVRHAAAWLAARAAGAAVAFVWLYAAQHMLGASEAPLAIIFLTLLTVFALAGAAAGAIEATVMSRLLAEEAATS